jgi:meiotically up-regulated gene 157 (Mug157) protein
MKKILFVSWVCLLTESLTLQAGVLGSNSALEKDNTRVYVTQRPSPGDRLFQSDAVEHKIKQIAKLLTNARLRWMFENCYPNTIDTTVRYYKTENGDDDTLIYTGDIHAMWLRDSGAQVWPYLQLVNDDPKLKSMLRGTILRQFKSIIIDPYANAFLDPHDPNPDHQWMSDKTDMKLELHERKWEIDSLCYVIRLAYEYWKITGDTSIFGKEWEQAIALVVQTFKEQQKKDGHGPYTFMRQTERQLDTMSNNGKGNPVKPVGLIASAFRPSDDATIFQFLIPSNFFAVTSLRKASEILTTITKDEKLAKSCDDLACEVEVALKKYATVNHPKYGTIYAFEVDGFGKHLMMDDANVPSLLAMPYLVDV